MTVAWNDCLNCVSCNEARRQSDTKRATRETGCHTEIVCTGVKRRGSPGVTTDSRCRFTQFTTTEHAVRTTEHAVRDFQSATAVLLPCIIGLNKVPLNLLTSVQSSGFGSQTEGVFEYPERPCYKLNPFLITKSLTHAKKIGTAQI